jgi:hypothetical protein
MWVLGLLREMPHPLNHKIAVQEYFSFDRAALARAPKEKDSANKKNRPRMLARYIAGA